MINATEQFKQEMIRNRNFYVTANCRLSDGTTLSLAKEDFYNSGNGIVDSSDSSDFPLGVAIEKTATLTLVNDTDKFSGYNFNAARFVLFLNLQLSDRLETIRKGTFIVNKKPATAEKINLTLLDHMSLADKAYTSNLVFPANAGEVLRDSCQTCGIALGDAAFPNSDYIIKEKPANTTHRAVIGAVAMLAGGNARIDENDYLRILNFDRSDYQESVDGGFFRPWTTGEELDGGTMNPWTSGSALDAGRFEEMRKRHIFTAITQLSYDTDDVEVTGVKVKEEDTEYLYGTDGYVLTIENPLIQGNIEDALQRIGVAVVGLTMRPFSFKSIADPTVVFMDPLEFCDVKGRSYFSYATNIDFVFNGYTSLSNKTKGAEDNSREYHSGNIAVVVEQAKKEMEKKLSAYDVAIRHMNQLAANSLGYHYTQVEQQDGSIVSYRHDKPTLAESKIVYKESIDGFFVTQNYSGDDATTVWTSGFDSNGDAVLNILYAIGIQSEWINTRGLTAKDNEGNITFRVDADTGAVYIEAEELHLHGKSVEEIADGQITTAISNIDGKIELAVSAERNRATGEEEKLTSKISVNESSIASEVTRAKNAEKDLTSKITQTADLIETKVSSDEVSSMISQSAESIRLKASKIAWDSTYSSMTENGKLTCESAEIKGKFSSGTLVIDDSKIKLGTNGLIDFGVGWVAVEYTDGSGSIDPNGLELVGKDSINLSSRYIFVRQSSSNPTGGVIPSDMHKARSNWITVKDGSGNNIRLPFRNGILCED